MELKRYLFESGLTQAELAKKLDPPVKQATISYMIKRGAIVIDNKIYSPQYEIKND